MLNFFEWGNVWLLLKVLRHALGQNFKPELIGFQSATPFSPMQKRKLSGIRVSRERETTSLVIRNDLLAAPLPDFFQRNTKDVEFPDLPAKLSFVDGMREVLKPCLSEDWFTVHTAAEMAGCSVRTLQRGLLDSGLTYSQLLDQLRVDVAQKLLARGGVRGIDIGLEVGFEDQSHFSRSFRRVTGITPSQYRCSMINHTSEVAHA